MSKKEEREKIAEAVNEAIKEDIDFEKCCEDKGFTVCSSAEEGTGKKKANL